MPSPLKLAHGRPCPYCNRQMERRHPRLAPSRDHVIPESKGGKEKIIACVQCNGIKGDMMLEVWEAFMAANPGWWLLSLRELRARRRMGFNTPGFKPAKQRASRERAIMPIDAPQPIVAPQIGVWRNMRKSWHKRVVVPPELIFLDQKLRT